MKTVYIYALIDPLDNQIRYIGKTVDMEARYRHHVYSNHKPKTHKEKWIASLRANFLKPQYVILEECTEETWEEKEKYYIAYYKGLANSKVTNLTAGGEGFVGLVFTEEHKKKLSLAKVGRKLSPEHAKKFGKCQTGRKMPAHVRRILSLATKGILLTKEHKNKLSIARRKRPPACAETRLKLSIAHKGKKRDPAVVAKISASKLGHCVNAETRAKISATLKSK